MTRPTLKDVRNWRDVTRDTDTGHVKVETGDLMYQGHLWTEGAWSVRSLKTGKRTLFYGESAWSDAERLVSDLYWASH